MNTMMAEKLNEMFKQEAFCIRFFDALEQPAELKAVLTENGIEVTDEELTELVAVAKAQIAKAEGEELSENELSDVAGGIWGYVVIGVAAGIFFGYQTYKSRKALNEGFCR